MLIEAPVYFLVFLAERSRRLFGRLWFMSHIPVRIYWRREVATAWRRTKSAAAAELTATARRIDRRREKKKKEKHFKRKWRNMKKIHRKTHQSPPVNASNSPLHFSKCHVVFVCFWSSVEFGFFFPQSADLQKSQQLRFDRPIRWREFEKSFN